MTDSTPAAARKFVQVDFVADVVCPWCYIGKRHLEIAAAMVADQIDVGFTWRAFELDPNVPPEGYDRRAYYEAKFGKDTARLKAMADNIEQAAADAGLEIALERIKKRPNTSDSHRVIHWSRAGKGHWTAAELLFSAYWRVGGDLSDPEFLAALAGEAGLDPSVTRALLARQDGLAAVRAENDQAAAMGVTGVPAFIFNRKTMIVGAHPPAAIADAMRQAAS